MKILILTSAHPTDDVRVHTKIAQGMAHAGHQVVWCGPRLSFFDSTLDEDIQWMLTPPGVGWRGRLTRLARSFVDAARVKDVDWIYTPDPDAAMAALPLARLTGAKTLFDIHEEYHDGLLRRGMGSPSVARILGRVVQAVIHRIARSTDLTISVSQTVLDAYTSASSERQVVLNTATSNFSRPNPRQDHPERLTAIHGKAMANNGSDVVLSALEMMSAAQAPETVFITRGAAGAAPFSAPVHERLVHSPAAARLRLMEGVPHEQMPDLLESCQIGIIAYGRILGAASLPNRLFEYMAMGLAVAAPSYSPDITRILDLHECGVSADFEEPRDVARQLASLTCEPRKTLEMGERGRQAFLQFYSWEAQLSSLLDRMENWR